MEGKIPISARPIKFDEQYFKEMYGEYEYDIHYEDFIINAIRFINAYNKEVCSACQQKVNIRSVLDAGCGKGHHIKAINKYKESLPSIEVMQGIDISEWAIKNADDSIKERVSVGDIRNIKFNNQSFDLVLCKDTIEHIPEKDINKAISELCRVSNKYILISVMTMKVYWDKDYTHQTIKDIDWWMNQFYKHGFTPIEARFNGVGFWEPVMLFQKQKK